MRANEPKRPDPRPMWGFLLLVALALWMLLFLQGCSPRLTENLRIQRDTVYLHQVQVDSIYRRDSVFVKEKGDTVYIYKDRIRERYRIQHDTVRLVKVDSVTVERVKEVKVEKPLSAWKSAKIGAFWWLVGAVVLLLVWTFRKTILKLFV